MRPTAPGSSPSVPRVVARRDSIDPVRGYRGSPTSSTGDGRSGDDQGRRGHRSQGLARRERPGHRPDLLLALRVGPDQRRPGRGRGPRGARVARLRRREQARALAADPRDDQRRPRRPRPGAREGRQGDDRGQPDPPRAARDAPLARREPAPAARRGRSAHLARAHPGRLDLPLRREPPARDDQHGPARGRRPVQPRRAAPFRRDRGLDRGLRPLQPPVAGDRAEHGRDPAAVRAGPRRGADLPARSRLPRRVPRADRRGEGRRAPRRRVPGPGRPRRPPAHRRRARVRRGRQRRLARAGPRR